ncbi:MAG TPA: maleylpyruvate isomerase N-terminal domain-containing protein [Candidatus Sulfotelmatobacter sp.]|nr:maleylpyruvate isomerase N-terminal domain-containing protein [Candidatus Sulfotelmatobacter sp.]
MERIGKKQLLARIRADRASFERALALVPIDRMTDPILAGAWSVKDVLAHLAWGDREAVDVIESRSLAGSELWALPEDERNEAVVRASRSRSVQAVLAEFHEAYDRYMAAIERLDQADLNEPDRLEGLSERIPGWRPWRLLYDPTHYAEHRGPIEARFGPSRDPGA